MADVFAVLDQADPGVVDRLIAMLERRGAEPRQCQMRRDYLARVALPDRARVIELGCGTGVLTRELAHHPRVETVLGIDNCARMLDAARIADPCGQYQCADAHCLPLPDGAADVVVAHTLFSHLPDPKHALTEAWRVLVPAAN